jgi:hypothetical protein
MSFDLKLCFQLQMMHQKSIPIFFSFIIVR